MQTQTAAKTKAETTTETPMPRRRIVLDIRVQADDVGEAAMALIDAIAWLERLEMKEGGAGRPIGEQADVIAQAGRTASVVVHDDHAITPELYRVAVARWKAAKARAEK